MTFDFLLWFFFVTLAIVAIISVVDHMISSIE